VPSSATSPSSWPPRSLRSGRCGHVRVLEDGRAVQQRTPQVKAEPGRSTGSSVRRAWSGRASGRWRPRRLPVCLNRVVGVPTLWSVPFGWQKRPFEEISGRRAGVWIGYLLSEKVKLFRGYVQGFSMSDMALMRIPAKAFLCAAILLGAIPLGAQSYQTAFSEVKYDRAKGPATFHGGVEVEASTGAVNLRFPLGPGIGARGAEFRPVLTGRCAPAGVGRRAEGTGLGAGARSPLKSRAVHGFTSALSRTPPTPKSCRGPAFSRSR